MLTFALISLLSFGVTAQDPSCTDGEPFIPHPNCSLYFQCANGFPELAQCPPPLFWNHPLQACDFPVNVPECDGGTRAPLPSTTPLPSTSPPQELRCGGVLKNPSDLVTYKADEAMDPNERCVWTVADSPGSFTFTLLTDGSLDPRDNVVVTLIRRVNGSLTLGSFTPSLPNQTYAGEADIVIITAFSDATSNSTGFSLTYSSVPFEGHENDDLPGRHEILSGLPSSLTFDTYENNDLSTVVFAPDNYAGGEEFNVTFVPRGDSTSVCPGDAVYAFEFDVSGNSSGILLHWSEFHGGCVSGDDGWSRSTREALLVVFRSDLSIPGTGFDLSFT